jgi:hypothetical protein
MIKYYDLIFECQGELVYPYSNKTLDFYYDFAGVKEHQ